MRLIGTSGQRNDIAFAHDLIDGIQAEAAIADKGYDADHLGVTGAALLFALNLIGRNDVSLYDGSWTEWGRPGNTPLEAG